MVRERKMSSPFGGSVATMFLGGAAALSSFVNRTALKVIVEPSVLRLMSLIGPPSLLVKTYYDIVMEKDTGVSALMKGDVSSAYLRENLVSLVERPKTKRGSRLEEKLSSLRLGREEVLTISLALSISHDRLFLLRPQARDVAKNLGLEPSPPFTILVDSLRRGVLSPNQFSDLAVKLLAWEGWHLHGGESGGI